MTSTTATPVSAAASDQCQIGVTQVKENDWIQAQTGEHLQTFVRKMLAVRMPKFMENRRKGTARAIRRATEAANLGLQGLGMSFCDDGSVVINLFPGYYNPERELRNIHKAFAHQLSEHRFSIYAYDTAAADNGAWFAVRLDPEYLRCLLSANNWGIDTEKNIQNNIDEMIGDLMQFIAKFKVICNRAVAGKAGWKSYI